jgi:hypothetical protein
MRTGQRSYIPGVGYIRIAEVAAVELTELTDADAVPDGFETADALRQEITELYAEKLARGFSAYRVVFKVLPEDEQHK